MAVALKVRAQLEKTLGESFRLKPWESIEQVVFEETTIKALMIVAEVVETTREVRIKKSGHRMLQWTRKPRTMMISGVEVEIGHYWQLTIDEVMWNQAQPEVIEVKYGTRLTPKQRDEKREFEKMCYRPGSADSPLDNYDRVLAGQTTPTMERYW